VNGFNMFICDLYLCKTAVGRSAVTSPDLSQILSCQHNKAPNCI